jgi:hypothetical protein
MKITEKDGELFIDLGNKLNRRVKTLFFFGILSGIPIIYSGLSYSIEFIQIQMYWLAALFIAILIIGILVSYRYCIRILRSESLLITSDTFFLITSVFNRSFKKPYEIDKISELNYNGPAHKTDHPLKGQSFDYLGFDTQEKVIASVNDEGNLSFTYGDKQVYFGRAVYSWDAEEINNAITSFTKGKLKIHNLPDEENKYEYQ